MINQIQKPLLIITEKMTAESVTLLKTSGFFRVEKLFHKDELKKWLSEVEILIIRSQTKINQELLDQTPLLKCIITSTSGFDHIDLNLTSKRNIQVCYTPDANTISAAELTWGLILQSARFLSESQKDLRSGHWSREQFTGIELSGKNIGIVGFGRIGQKIYEYSKAFGMIPCVFDPYQDDEVFKKYDLQRSSYEEVLKTSDILTYHVPKTSETYHMLNKSHFEFLNRPCIVINTSRGGVVAEDDLIQALENKWVSAAALDVYEKEPLPRDSKLLKTKGLFLSQHIGAMTEDAFEKASKLACEYALDFIQNKKMKNTLPLVNDWGKLSFNKEKS